VELKQTASKSLNDFDKDIALARKEMRMYCAVAQELMKTLKIDEAKQHYYH